MEIGNWKSAEGLDRSYGRIRDLGLESHVAELDAFGFTVIEGAASPELVDRVKAAIMKTADSRESTPSEGMVYQNHLLVRDPAFEEALMLEKPLALVKYMLGESCIFSTMGSHLRGPGGVELGLHADIGGWYPEPYPQRAQLVNSTLMITDYTRDSGALAVVPCSHDKCRAPGADIRVEDNELAIPVEAPAGSVVLWHGNLWHGGYVRQVPGYRVNLAMVFVRPALVPQEDYRGLITEEMFERNGEVFARLLGRDLPWNYGEAGPDYDKMGRNAYALRSWRT